MAKPIGKDGDREFVKKLCDLEIPNDIKISPSGEKVLYSTGLTWGHMTGKYPVSTLWLATLGEAGSAKKITDGTFKDHSLTWHPLKDEFALISDRAGHATKSAIYTVSIADLSKFTPITPTENEQAIEMFRYSPDGKLIAYISKDEKTEEEKQREERKEDVQVWGQDYRYSRLRIIDLETQEVNTLQINQQILDVCWNATESAGSKGYELSFLSCKTPVLEYPFHHGSEIYVVGQDLQQPRRLCSVPGRANDLCWGSTNFGESEELYFRCRAPADKNFGEDVLHKVSTDKGPCEHERVVFEGNHNLTSLRSVGGHIVVKSQDRLDDVIIWVGCEEMYRCPQEIEAYDVAFEFSDGDARLVIATSDVNHPVEVYTVAERDDKKVQLSRHGEAFKGKDFGTYSVLTCETSDDHKIEIDGIFLQPIQDNGSQSTTTPTEPRPLIVLVHGGPTTRVTNAFNTLYYMWTPYLLSLGYAILLPNYRGSSGRGEEFALFSYDGVGVHAYSDVIDLTQYAIEKGDADPNQLIIGGASHGGLLTNLCAVRNGSHGHGWKYKAAISQVGISDIDTMAVTSDMAYAYHGELHGYNLPWTMDVDDTSTRSASALWGFKEAAERSKKEGSPVIPPYLIMHGANDERCHIANAWALRRALEHYSVPFEMAVYPRQGHMVHEQTFWIDMALRISRWVEKYIGPGPRASTVALR